MKDTFISTQVIEQVAEIIEKNKNIMPFEIARQLHISEETAVRALPEEMRHFAAISEFDRIWEAMTSWEKSTFLCHTPTAIIEVKGKLPQGKYGHGFFNLMDKDNPLGGHLRIDSLGSICFLEKLFFGMDSLSVQFFDKEGNQMFAVFAGRENRELIPSVKEAFHTLKQEVQGE